MDYLEVLYENYDVAVTHHSANSTLGDGVVNKEGCSLWVVPPSRPTEPLGAARS